MKYVIAIISLFLLSFSNHLYAQKQTKTYDILVDNEKVGTLTATKESDDDKTTYEVNSKSVVHLFGETVITTSLVVIFRKGMIEYASFTTEKDGKPYDSSIITESKGVYSVNRKGVKSTIQGQIKYTRCLLYFEEPNINEKYFDVLEAAFSTMDKTGPNKYVYSLPDRNETTTYTFDNNTLEECITQHTFYEFELTLKTDSN